MLSKSFWINLTERARHDAEGVVNIVQMRAVFLKEVVIRTNTSRDERPGASSCNQSAGL